ncbi:MAG: hypothetical protein GY822_06900 [Deltaproteobacteria bacterium]|nr:hypothetical protein [Deltaproteobacteria bacterium]
MEELRARLEAEIAEVVGERKASFGNWFVAADEALVSGEAENAVYALGELAAACGKELQFSTFDEFDALMLEDAGPLVL